LTRKDINSAVGIFFFFFFFFFGEACQERFNCVRYSVSFRGRYKDMLHNIIPAVLELARPFVLKASINELGVYIRALLL
jgi:hypothetical protein